jgi:hypothetical protein
MAKTEMEILEEISQQTNTSVAELKALKTESAENKKTAEDLTAKVLAMETELKAKDATIGDMLTEVKEIKAKGGRPRGATGGEIMTLRSLLVKTIGENKDKFIAAETKAMDPISFGKDIEIVEQKAVANIASANLSGTGNNYISYLDWQPGMEPTGQFRFRSLFRVIQSETDFVRFPRANTPIGEGSFARVAESGTKPQIDRDYTMIDLTLQPMAGYAIVSRQSLRNIRFLQSWLPTSMMEQLEDSEDTDFANKLVASATGNTTTAGITAPVERFIYFIQKLIAAKYRPNFIAGDPAVWAAMLIYRPGTDNPYSLPNVVTIGLDGQVRVLGIPFYPVNWLGGNRVIVGDSTKAAIVQSEGLVMRQTDSHANTFITNELTFLLERTENLAIFRPDAFSTTTIS